MKWIKKCFIEYNVICLLDGGEPFLRVLCQISHSCVCVPSHFSRVRHFATLWTVARQAPLSIGFSRPEYWSGLPFLPPEDLPNPGIKPASRVPLALAGRFPSISAGKELLLRTMQETPVQFLGWKDLLEKGMATHSSILAWRIQWTTVRGVTELD